MTSLTDFMNIVTNIVLEIILLSLWTFALAILIKWFLIKAKAGLHYLFPRCIWFKTKKEREEKE